MNKSSAFAATVLLFTIDSLVAYRFYIRTRLAIFKIEETYVLHDPVVSLVFLELSIRSPQQMSPEEVLPAQWQSLAHCLAWVLVLAKGPR